MNPSLKITLLSCAILGFRHGFDYDHIAAITDITSVQKRAATSMRLGLAYALGHASMIAVLGAVVILFQLSLPHRFDSIAERLVGLTLILLAIYVVGSLVWGNPHAIPPSRAALIIRGYRKLRRRLWPHPADADGIHPLTDEDLNYTGPIAFGIGIIHGLGAETPSQLALFLLAANLGGAARGIAGMGMFLTGLLIMNTLMTASASGLFQGAAPHPRTMRFFVGLTAVYSFIVGWIFLLGASGNLPALG
jgi:high-affinity nickel permease